MGEQRLLFSLHQLEYLQYYIHEMRLTDPEHVTSLVNQNQENAEDKENVSPIANGAIPEWVPLPSSLIRLEFFQKLASIQ